MLAWVLTATAAYGGVKTEDTTSPRCLDPEKVELEVRAAVGDETVDRMDLLVQLSGTEQWQLALTVRDASGTLWNRIVPAEPVDCPYLTELVGQSFERGLSELPGWGLPTLERSGPEIGFLASTTWPDAVRFGVGLEMWFSLGERLGLDLQLSGVQSMVERIRVGKDLVGVAFVSGQLEVGLGFVQPLVKKQQLRLSSRVGVGPALGVGLGFSKRNVRTVLPRASFLQDVLWAPNRNLRLGARLEIPIVGMGYATSGGMAFGQEPFLRAGLVLGISEKLGRGDGGRAQRP